MDGISLRIKGKGREGKMVQEKGMATQQTAVGITVPPDIVLANAMVAAKALKDVISKKAKPVILNGEQYLEFEDWQTCGQFYGYTVKTGEAVAVEVDGIKGAKAHADLIDLKTGEIVGGAEAYCMRDEEHWNTRPKYEWQGEKGDRKRVQIGEEVVPWFQLASMAQTRAGAKAFRNRLAWVVVLAGYRPTPAEEMTDDTGGPGKPKTVEHWCTVHNTAFFKSAKMRSYAHPIAGSKEWCYEPAAATSEPINQPTPDQARQEKIKEDKKATTVIPAKAGSQLAEDPGQKAAFEKLESAGGKIDDTPQLLKDIAKCKWKEATAIGYFRNTLKVEIPAGDNFYTAFGRLSEKQQNDFKKKMAENAEAAGK